MTKPKEVVLFFGGMLWQQAVTFAAGVFVARWLGPADYGILSIVRNVFTVALIMAPLGMDLSLLRHLAEYDKADDTAGQVRLLRMIVLAVNLSVLAATLFLIGPFLQTHVYSQPHLTLYLTLTFVALPFAADTQLLTAVFRARRRPAFQVIASLYIQPLVRVAALIAFGLAGFGLPGVVLATAAGYAASSLTMSIALRRIDGQDGVTRRPISRHEVTAVRGVFNYSVWLGALLLTYGVLRNVDILILGHFRAPREVGEYAALSTIAQIIPIYPQALSQTLGPTIAKFYKDGDMLGIKRELSNYLRRASLLSSPIFGAVAAFGPWLNLLFGKKYEFHPWLSLNLGAAFLISALLNPMGFPLSMTGRHKTEFMILITGTVGAILLCMTLAPTFGPNGVALGTSAGYLFINVVRMGVTSRFLRIIPGSLRDLGPPLICAVVGYTLKFSADAFLPRSAIVAIGVGLIYGVLVLISYWVVMLNPEEKEFVVSRWNGLVLRRLGFST